MTIMATFRREMFVKRLISCLILLYFMCFLLNLLGSEINPFIKICPQCFGHVAGVSPLSSPPFVIHKVQVTLGEV